MNQPKVSPVRSPSRRKVPEADAPGSEKARLFATSPASGKRTRIAVVRGNGEWHMVALQPFAEGERILTIEGELVAQPSRHSIQVDEGRHVEIPEDELKDLERVFDAYPWRFLNHSCDPSARVEGRKILALRSLVPWEEITFDYNTTEERMATPFKCRCGHCGGRTIGGFGRLARADQERLAPNLAPHLRRRLDRPSD